MKRIEVIRNLTGVEEEIIRNGCTLDFGYEHHFVCDGNHCQECWEVEEKE